MEELTRQVTRARRRLTLQQFVRIAPWCLFATLLVALIGIAVPKIWPLEVTSTDAGWQIWFWSWAGGGLALGLAIATVWTLLVRRGSMEAAIEIDRRFGLKERVSSSLALGSDERQSDVGQALLEDAVKRVSSLDVRERFGVSTSWPAFLPLAPLAGLCALALVANASLETKEISAADAAAKQASEQVKKSAEELKKKVAERRKDAEQRGLEDADMLLKKLQEGIEQMAAKEQVDRKAAMVKINDLAKELEKRRDQLGGAEKLKKQFEQMKNLQRGPADKAGKAFKDGDFKKALKETRKLQEQLASGKMTPEEQKQLAKQLSDIQKQAEEMTAAHEQAKQELAEQIKKKQEQGDLAGANKLQEKLDQLKQMDKEMGKMKELASQLGKASEQLEKGDSKAASQELAKAAENLESMQAKLDELQTINEMMNEIADAKSAMNCKECNGAGCESCQQGQGKSSKMGQGMGRMTGSQKAKGNGLGKGRGQGERPEEETDTGAFDTKVAGKPKAGEAIRAGFADGANLPGRTLQDVRESIGSSMSSEPDAQNYQRLPKAQREQARQYFEKFRKGE